ncbi:uncharacterized protein LOC116004965 [Ipomoea triloba]|uniref:uncharacterized protein LOC116004965 n=1 Tax=Ipomoea triloba TaxID=35885 RepID=UPI00125D7584|nr:uncharacterized protein LOC116004965 [Ipomoea triloba]
MCPLRIILIFLSVTLAGFFAFRNLKTPSDDYQSHAADETPVKLHSASSLSSSSSLPICSKVCGVIGNGFWTFVDMASGRYVWRHLVSSSNLNLKRADDLKF